MKLIKIIAQLNPFSTEKTFFEFESDTVINILKKIDSNRAVNTGWRVMLNDQIVTNFETVVPEGASLYVKLVPEGDSAGETASKIGVWGGVAAMIAGTVLLFIPGLQLAGGIILGVGCGMFTSAGVVYLNYQQQKLLDQEKPEADPSIRGSRNQSRPMQTIPTLFGKRRIYPDLIMNPYTEVDSSGNQYLCQLFCAGQKDQEIDTSSIKIEETLLTDYSASKNINTVLAGNDDHIKMKIHYGDSALTYFTKCVHEKQFNSILENKLEDDTSGAVIWTTPAGTTEINCDIFFYNGLGKYNDKGEIQSTSVEVKAYYKQKNEADSAYKLLGYFNNGTNTISGSQLKTLRYVVSKAGLSADSYTVKIERTTADSESSSVVDTVYLGSIRAKKNTSPVRSKILKKLCVIELKVKATPKLQNIIEQLNFVSQSKMPIYSGSGTGKNSWSTNALTSNPASCALMAMQGEFAQQKLKETDIDWLSFEKLYNWCQTHNYKCNYYLTESLTISQLLSNIATCSRSEIFRLNGKITVVQDIERDSPVQLFTPRNSKNYTETLLKTEIPDCLTLKFVNKDSGFAEDEVNVYNTTSGNKETEPEISQEVNLWGVTSSEQARKVGMYDLAVFRARSVVHTFQVDFEYMLCTKGDWIKYAGDIALAGLKQGRIQKLLFDNSNKIVGFVSDELLPMEQANNYAVRIRKNDGEIVLCDLAYFEGNHLEVYFVDSYNADEFQEQNLFAFGIRGQETIDLIVTNITCQDNLTAEITAVEYAPKIFEVDSPNFVLPDFESKISDVPGVVDSGAVDLSDWRTFYTYNDSEAQPAKPTGNGTANGWHRNSTSQSKWMSSKTAKDINSGEWSAPSPTGNFIFDKILSDEPTIDNPDAPEFLTAFAEENGIKISCSTKKGIKNSISKYIFEINKGSVWIQKTSESSEFFYVFDRNSDGYPEGTDLSKWKIRAKLRSVYGKESNYSSKVFVNIDTYGTWQVQQPEVIVSSNKRLISLNLTQGKRADAKQVYGAVGYKVLVNRPDLDDEEFFTPATNKNPSASESNYKNNTTESIIVGTTYIQEMPLKGQNAKKWKFKYYETRENTFGTTKDSVSYLDNLDSVIIPDSAEKTESYIYWTQTTEDLTLTQHFEYSLVDMPSPEETYYRFKIVAVNLNAGNESSELIIGTYARANSASDLVDNAITQNALAPDAVTAEKIAAGTITAEKIAAEDLLVKGARAGMVSTEGVIVDDSAFLASKTLEYKYTDPVSKTEKTYIAEPGEFFVGNTPEINDERDASEYLHYKPGEGFWFKIKNFIVKGLSTIIKGDFFVKDGSISIQGGTFDTVTSSDSNPHIEFANKEGKQKVRLTYTDFDSYQKPASLTLVGEQGQEYFITPNAIIGGYDLKRILFPTGTSYSLETTKPLILKFFKEDAYYVTNFLEVGFSIQGGNCIAFVDLKIYGSMYAYECGVAYSYIGYGDTSVDIYPFVTGVGSTWDTYRSFGVYIENRVGYTQSVKILYLRKNGIPKTIENQVSVLDEMPTYYKMNTKLKPNSVNETMMMNPNSTSLDKYYPIGSIYMSVNSTSPATLFGGYWVRLKDRFLLGAGDTYSAGATGGEATHTLSLYEMPSHNHPIGNSYNNTNLVAIKTTDRGKSSLNDNATGDIVKNITITTGNAGASFSHNNMPPYTVVYMWKRVTEAEAATLSIT